MQIKIHARVILPQRFTLPAWLRLHATLSAKGLSPADLTINLRGAAPWPGLHCTQQPPAVVVAGDAMQLQLQLQLQIDAFAILPCFLSFFSFFTNTQKNCASLLY